MFDALSRKNVAALNAMLSSYFALGHRQSFAAVETNAGAGRCTRSNLTDLYRHECMVTCDASGMTGQHPKGGETANNERTSSY